MKPNNKKIGIYFGDYIHANSQNSIRFNIDSNDPNETISKLLIPIGKKNVDKTKTYIFYNVDILSVRIINNLKEYPILDFIEEYYPRLKEVNIILVDYKNSYIPYNYLPYFKINVATQTRDQTWTEYIHYVLTETDRIKVFETIKKSRKKIRYLVKVLAMSIQTQNDDEGMNEVLKNFDKFIYKVNTDIVIGIIAFGIKPIGKIPLIFPYKENKEKVKKPKAQRVRDINIKPILNKLDESTKKNMRSVL